MKAAFSIYPNLPVFSQRMNKYIDKSGNLPEILLLCLCRHHHRFNFVWSTNDYTNSILSFSLSSWEDKLIGEKEYKRGSCDEMKVGSKWRRVEWFFWEESTP